MTIHFAEMIAKYKQYAETQLIVMLFFKQKQKNGGTSWNHISSG